MYYCSAVLTSPPPPFMWLGGRLEYENEYIMHTRIIICNTEISKKIAGRPRCANGVGVADDDQI